MPRGGGRRGGRARGRRGPRHRHHHGIGHHHHGIGHHHHGIGHHHHGIGHHHHGIGHHHHHGIGVGGHLHHRRIGRRHHGIFNFGFGRRPLFRLRFGPRRAVVPAAAVVVGTNAQKSEVEPVHPVPPQPDALPHSTMYPASGYVQPVQPPQYSPPNTLPPQAYSDGSLPPTAPNLQDINQDGPPPIGFNVEPTNFAQVSPKQTGTTNEESKEQEEREPLCCTIPCTIL